MGETPIAKSPVLYLCTQLFHTFIVYFDPGCGFFLALCYATLELTNVKKAVKDKTRRGKMEMQELEKEKRRFVCQIFSSCYKLSIVQKIR